MAWNTFDGLLLEMAQGTHNFNTDALYAVLTDTAPVASHTVLGDIIQISATGGYGALAIGTIAASVTDGVLSVTATGNAWTPSGADFDAARYVAVYNATASNKLVCWADYGVSYAVPDGVPFTITGGTLFSIRVASA